MKLRQKLAVVLASAMVITAVPVTTMAASTNGFNKTLSIVADKAITTDAGLVLKVDYAKVDADKITEDEPDVFFVNATDFEFEKAAYNYKNDENVTVDGSTKDDWNGFTVEWLSKTQLKVVVTAATNGEPVEVPVAGTPKKGNPAITLDGEDSLATSGKYSLSGAEVVTDKVLAATAGDAKNISIEGAGSIADITIEEKVAGQLSGKTVTITLPNSSDLVFNTKYSKDSTASKAVEIEGKRGLADVKTGVTAAYAVENNKEDNKKLVVTFPTMTSKTRGAIVLKGIEVQAEDKKADVSTGEVKVTVKADKMDDTKLVVANVCDFGVTYTVKEVKELTAGQGKETIKVTIKENAVDTLNKNRPIYFTLEEGYFAKDTVIKSDQKGFSFNADKDEITLDLKNNADFKEGKINEFTFEVEVSAKATNKGPVVMVATSRNFEEDMKLEVAKVTPAVEVKSEPITVKAGLKDQVGGKIVIKETAEEKLAKNKKIIIKADNAWGFEIQDAKIAVTGGDIQIDEKVNKDGELEITVKRTSSEASEITISDIKVTTNRTIPEGTFDFLVGGTAISQKNVDVDTTNNKEDERFDDALTVKDFIKVSTKNTEDLPNAAAAKEIVLTINAKEYTVNGEAKTADAAAFIDANNRTMVPVRFVAEEFGKIDFGTVNGVGTVTVFKDGSVLQFQNGSNVMNKNGIAIPMDTNVVIKDGRTYVPFKYVADGLGINYSFDAATKSITFTNQAQ